MKCKICKKIFRLKKENRYEFVKRPQGLKVLTEGTEIFECFDCPRCGCQNIVNIREGTTRKTQDEKPIIEAFNMANKST